MSTPPDPSPFRSAALVIPYAGVAPTIDAAAWLAPTAVLVGDWGVYLCPDSGRMGQ
jgi:hypothetical protein